TSTPQITPLDNQTLTAIFDPESASSVPTPTILPTLPSDPHIPHSLLQMLKAREIAVIRTIESAAPSEKHMSYLHARQSFEDLISAHLTYASAYNNLAQLIRWRFGDRGTLVHRDTEMEKEVGRAMNDAIVALNKAVKLAAPETPTAPVSPAQARTLAQAYTQLGSIFYSAFKDLQAAEEDGVTWREERFEEEASRCFFRGGLYGNEIGRAMAVHTNPYAKLCGSIVKEAMRRE
ncbi:hypothetical protein M501DRAFT_908241, partial [Patellaria atrata CBS 101060]